MNTIARKSTASKWSRMRLPGAGAHVIVRVYQRNSSGSSARPTPESADSMANGTRILPAQVSGRPGVFVTLVTCQSQSPLRHVQLSRTICGRGYSRQQFALVTFSPHGVISGAAPAAVITHAAAPANPKVNFAFMACFLIWACKAGFTRLSTFASTANFFRGVQIYGSSIQSPDAQATSDSLPPRRTTNEFLPDAFITKVFFPSGISSTRPSS